MHIFLVNDDGIGSCGIMALAGAAAAMGHRVSICAPKAQQSAASHRITLAEPIYVSAYPVSDARVTAYAIAGTPTDCVRLGLLELVKDPVDVLISGINNGHNSGMAVHYSGTVGAAREGALNHLHAIAASISFNATQKMIDHFAAYVVKIAEEYVNLPLPPATVLNVNAPLRETEELKPPVFTPLSTANFVDSYIRRESPRAGTYYWLAGGAHTESFPEGSDQDMLERGHITLTMMGNPTDHGEEYRAFAAACQIVYKAL
jgi:5'-nucleotidase